MRTPHGGPYFATKSGPKEPFLAGLGLGLLWLVSVFQIWSGGRLVLTPTIFGMTGNNKLPVTIYMYN